MNFVDEHFSKLAFIEFGNPFKIVFITLVLCSLDSSSVVSLVITHFQTSIPWVFKKCLSLASHISKFPLNNGAFANWLTSISMVEEDTSLGGLETFFLGFAICVLMINLQAVRLWVKVLALIPIVGNTERGWISISFQLLILPVRSLVFRTQKWTMMEYILLLIFSLQ